MHEVRTYTSQAMCASCGAESGTYNRGLDSFAALHGLQDFWGVDTKNRFFNSQ